MTGDIETSVRRLEYGHWLRRRTLREAAERVAAMEQNSYLRRKTARFGGPPKNPDLWTCGSIKLPTNLAFTDPINGPVTLSYNVTLNQWTGRRSRTRTDPFLIGIPGVDCAIDSNPLANQTEIEYRFNCVTSTLEIRSNWCGRSVGFGLNITYRSSWASSSTSVVYTAIMSGTPSPFNYSATLNSSIALPTDHRYSDLYGSVSSVTFTLTKPA